MTSIDYQPCINCCLYATMIIALIAQTRRVYAKIIVAEGSYMRVKGLSLAPSISL